MPWKKSNKILAHSTIRIFSMEVQSNCRASLTSSSYLFSPEVRTHGVGYYGFSAEEEKREEQLKMLNQLRDDVGLFYVAVYQN